MTFLVTWSNGNQRRRAIFIMQQIWGSVKHLKLSEKDAKSLQAPTVRDCLVLYLMSLMRRGGGGWCWLLWWLKSPNGLKLLINKLQSAAWCLLARVQSPKEENLHWNSVTCHLLSNIFMNFYKEWMWQCDTCVKHLPKFIMRIIYKFAEIFLWVSAKIKAEKSKKTRKRKSHLSHGTEGGGECCIFTPITDNPETRSPTR